jgi:hypothetical protein
MDFTGWESTTQRYQYIVLSGIFDLNFTFAQNHTPVALLRKAYIAMAGIGGNPGSFWQFG